MENNLPGIIERDLAEIKNQLSENAFSGHKLLSDQTNDIEELPLAKALLNSASLGDYRSDELIPLATGLELLRLAAEMHYRHADGRSARDNFFLVAADYYYARAILLASGLNKGYLVERMVKSIAEIAEAEAETRAGVDQAGASDVSGGYKQASLLKAASELGLWMGNYSSCMQDL